MIHPARAHSNFSFKNEFIKIPILEFLNIWKHQIFEISYTSRGVSRVNTDFYSNHYSLSIF